MSEGKPSFGLRYSMTAPRISEQVTAQGYRITDDNAKWIDEAADDLSCLHVRGILTRGEVAMARSRLHRHVMAACVPATDGNEP